MPQPDGGESQASGLTLVSVAVLARALEALIALQPAEMLHVLGPFRREGGIERDFLAAHAATGARFIGVHGGVPPLVDEADEGRRRHRPWRTGNPAPCRNPPAATTQGSRVFPHPRLPPPLSFSEDGCTERQKPTAL